MVTSMEETVSARNDLWVFRDGRRAAPAASLYRGLQLSLNDLVRGPIDARRVITALLRAGELESALADASMEESRQLEFLTDTLARVLCGDSSSLSSVQHLKGITRVPESTTLAFSPAEGFAYYALHPLDFARLDNAMLSSARPAAVIGIRSIGTTLSAIVKASLRKSGKPAERITVRPTGHPYERVTRFSGEQKSWIEQFISQGADFLVVDEGPGRSGSSFLSAGEALVKAGVPAAQILFVGSREIDPQQLCAANAAARWNSFRFTVPRAGAYQRFAGDVYLGGGAWRRELPGCRTQPVACWPQMERLKFLSRDKEWLFKFEGFGHFGQEILERNRALVTAGFATRAEEAGDGMIRYRFVKGTMLRSADVSRDLLDRMAEYCAFRWGAFAVSESQPNQLAEMLAFNLEQSFGLELNIGDRLESKRPLIVDGRMQPHEWIRSSTGRVIKVDACSHGDDHFFPGPTDIAWDLAGAIVEWNLDEHAADYLVRRFRQLSGEDATPRLAAFLLAYSVFRHAYCRMALTTVGQQDETLLKSASEHYWRWAKSQISARTAWQMRDDIPGQDFCAEARRRGSISSLEATKPSLCAAPEEHQ